MAKLIILVGPPGCGKSTYGQTLCDLASAFESGESYVIHSSDAIRKELFGNEASQEDNNRVFQIMHKRVKADLAAGKNVIYDATNVTRKSRRAAINLASKNDIVECHIVWAPIITCRKRDANRERTVGPDVINKFIRRWQSPWYDEGFDNIVLHCSDENFDQAFFISRMTRNMMIPHDNPHHSVGVLEHCELAHQYMIENPDIINDEEFEALKSAAYWHDIGKPLTKGYKNKPGTDEIDYSIAHYYDHQAVGGYLSYGLFLYEDYSLKCTRAEYACFVSWLISTHMEPFFESKYYKQLDQKLKRYVDILHKADLEAH